MTVSLWSLPCARLEPGGVFQEVRFSSVFPGPCDKSTGMAATTPPVRTAVRPRGKTIFGSSPAPRLNGARSGVGNVMTRLLSVFRSGSSAAYSDSSPGAHSHFFHFWPVGPEMPWSGSAPTPTLRACSSRSLPLSAAQPGAWESMFHPRLLPKRARPFSVVTGFNTR